jgi:phage/plasmid-associated DNA primase
MTEKTEIEQAGLLLAQIPATIACNYDYFIDVGRALKSVSDLLFDEWFEWAEAHESKFADDKQKRYREWKNLESDIDGLTLLTGLADETTRREIIEETKNFTQLAFDKLYGDSKWVCINDILHYWNGTHYEPSTEAVERRRIWKFCNEFRSLSNLGNGKTQVTYKYAEPRIVSKVYDWIKQGTAIDPRVVNPPGLNLANGVLTFNWENRRPAWELRSHHPEMVYTYVSQTKFDPNADPGMADKLLLALDSDQKDVFLKTVAAALDLINVRKYLPERVRALLLQGDGNNGKDTLREAVSEIFAQGLTGCSLRDFVQYDEGRKFPLAKLDGSRVNWASENHSNLSLDKLQSLKNVISGEPLSIEPKNQNEYTIKPQCITILNCNEIPSILAAQEAIESRYCIVKFTKTFSSEADLESGRLLADPRFKNDPDFLREQVCPALLNYVLDAFSRLMTEGINYKSLSYAISEAQQSSSHLFEWAKDVGLTTGKDRIKLGDLWESLKQWYIDNDILEIKTTDQGTEKFIWLDEFPRYDPLVKAPRLIKKALQKTFPKVKFSDRTKDGYFVIGLSFINSIISTSFASFGSGKEEKVEESMVLAMNQSMKQMNLTPEKVNQNQGEANDPNQNGHTPLKSLPEEDFTVDVAKQGKKNHSTNLKNITEKEIKIGDRVVIAKVAKALKVNPRMPLAQQTAIYTVEQVGEDSAKCFAVSIGTYWFPLDYLGVINHE